MERLNANASDYTENSDILVKLHAAYAALNEVGLARDHYVEIGYYGTDLLRFAMGFRSLYAKKIKGEKLSDEDLLSLQKRIDGFYKNYDYETDKAVFKALMPFFQKAEKNQFKPYKR